MVVKIEISKTNRVLLIVWGKFSWYVRNVNMLPRLIKKILLHPKIVTDAYLPSFFDFVHHSIIEHIYISKSAENLPTSLSITHSNIAHILTLRPYLAFSLTSTPSL